MKIVCLLFILLCCNEITFGQTLNKSIIGSWKILQTDHRSYSETDETWSFQNTGKGTWDRVLMVSGNAIICRLKNPFAWSITDKKQIKIHLGKTTCSCKASESKFEKGLDKFIENLKAAFDNEYFEYKIKFSGDSVVYFDELKLERKK